MYVARKTWSQERGPSVCFRNHHAGSHCKYLHGYALGITIEFASRDLDVRNWVIDFGGLKDLKQLIDDAYDHRLLVAEDDPDKALFIDLGTKGLANVRIMAHTSVEAFAADIYHITGNWLGRNPPDQQVHVVSVTVSEHTGNEVNFAEEIWV